MIRKFQAGDIIYVKNEEKHTFDVCKILKIEHWSETLDTWHILWYEPLSHPPTVNDIQNLTIQGLHAPVVSFAERAVFIINVPVTGEELEGYYTYLKMTNFRKYLEETDQELNSVIQQATEAYKRGYNLTDQGNLAAAIAAYTEAIEIFPFLYEVLDNRGFIYMELSQYQQAIYDFMASLEINPAAFVATFSIGECYYHLQDFSLAEKFFQEAAALEPENPLASEWLMKTRQAAKK